MHRKPEPIGKVKKVICPNCDGLGYIEFSEYEEDPNDTSTPTAQKCNECQGKGYLEGLVVKQ